MNICLNLIKRVNEQKIGWEEIFLTHDRPRASIQNIYRIPIGGKKKGKENLYNPTE